jgi:hypothetical protein
MDANWRKQWEDNIAMFQSRHPTGSKYNSDAYKHKLAPVPAQDPFRGEQERGRDCHRVLLQPRCGERGGRERLRPAQVVSAELMQHILNYRLQKTIPWFPILVGAAQTAQVIGIVCSYQYWHYKEKVTTSHQPLTDEMGNPSW